MTNFFFPFFWLIMTNSLNIGYPYNFFWENSKAITNFISICLQAIVVMNVGLKKEK